MSHRPSRASPPCARTTAVDGVAALVADGLYLALAFGLRTVMQLRRTGSAEWFAGVLFVVALFVAGLAATLVAQIAMGESWRIGVDEAERTDLVTYGPFSLARNPIFAAMLPASLGLALMVPSWVAAVGVVARFVALELQVRIVEEPYLGCFARRTEPRWDQPPSAAGASQPRAAPRRQTRSSGPPDTPG